MTPAYRFLPSKILDYTGALCPLYIYRLWTQRKRRIKYKKPEERGTRNIVPLELNLPWKKIQDNRTSSSVVVRSIYSRRKWGSRYLKIHLVFFRPPQK